MFVKFNWNELKLLIQYSIYYNLYILYNYIPYTIWSKMHKTHYKSSTEFDISLGLEHVSRPWPQEAVHAILFLLQLHHWDHLFLQPQIHNSNSCLGAANGSLPINVAPISISQHFHAGDGISGCPTKLSFQICFGKFARSIWCFNVASPEGRQRFCLWFFIKELYQAFTEVLFFWVTKDYKLQFCKLQLLFQMILLIYEAN